MILSIAQTPDRFYARRRALVQKLGCPILIAGVSEGPHGYAPVHQEPLFLYLTGITQPHCVLYADETSDWLICDDKDYGKERWEGDRFGAGVDTARVQAYAGIQHCIAYADLPAILKNCTRIGLHNTGAALYHWVAGARVYDITAALWPERYILDAVDQHDFKQAYAKTDAAWQAFLSQWPTLAGTSETVATGRLIGELLSQTPYGLSFPPIVAGGKNALVLHYTTNNASFEANTLVLCDFGLRWRGMCSDMTRVISTGVMNPLQARLYAIVQAAKDRVTAAAVAGVTLSYLNTLAWDIINASVQALCAETGGICAYERKPHNIGHLIGYEVHEGADYQDKPLHKNMAITIEPGLYCHVNMRLDGIDYDDAIGIRLEDGCIIA